MTRFDTTPSDVDRQEARRLLGRLAGLTDAREAAVLGLVGSYVSGLRELEDPGDAHQVARVRALLDAYLEEEGNFG